MNHCFEQAVCIALVCVAMKMQQPVFVGFLYTCVSIFVRFLIISTPIKEFLLSIGSSIVEDRLGWRLLLKSSEKISCSSATSCVCSIVNRAFNRKSTMRCVLLYM